MSSFLQHENQADRPRKKRDVKKGFTLTEVMVGMMIASILALASGAILIYGYSTLMRNNNYLELQRDMTLAMDMLAREVRNAKGSTIKTGVGEIEFNDVVVNPPVIKIYQDSDDLMYDPDTSVTNNDERVIVANRLLSFSVMTNQVGVSVSITMEEGERQIEVNEVLTWRKP